MKFCPKCLITKNISDFSKDKSRTDGLDSYCKQCRCELRDKNKESAKIYRRIYYPTYYAKYKKALMEYQRKYIKANRSKVNKWKVNYTRKRRYALTTSDHFTLLEWEQLVHKYHYICLKCEASIKLTVDHVVPLSLGGKDTIDNIQPLCGSCNSSKGQKNTDYKYHCVA